MNYSIGLALAKSHMVGCIRVSSLHRGDPFVGRVLEHHIYQHVVQLAEEAVSCVFVEQHGRIAVAHTADWQQWAVS